MSLEDGVVSKEKFSAKEQIPASGSKTQRPLKTGNIGDKRGGKTKK